MLVKQVVMLRNVPVVEIRDPKVEDDVEQEGKVQDREIKAIFPNPNIALHS